MLTSLSGGYRASLPDNMERARAIDNRPREGRDAKKIRKQVVDFI
jgi:hypothetical protein